MRANHRWPPITECLYIICVYLTRGAARRHALRRQAKYTNRVMRELLILLERLINTALLSQTAQ
jgi:hypothetical protein